MTNSFMTLAGQRLVEHTLPLIAESLTKIAEELKQGNEMRKQELHTDMELKLPNGNLVISKHEGVIPGFKITLNNKFLIAAIEIDELKVYVHGYQEGEVDPVFTQSWVMKDKES